MVYFKKIAFSDYRFVYNRDFFFLNKINTLSNEEVLYNITIIQMKNKIARLVSAVMKNNLYYGTTELVHHHINNSHWTYNHHSLSLVLNCVFQFSFNVSLIVHRNLFSQMNNTFKNTSASIKTEWYHCMRQKPFSFSIAKL